MPPMRILGFASESILFKGDSVVTDVPVKAVDGLPYVLIESKKFLQDNRSSLDFGVGRGFQPVPGAPWVPFDRSVQPAEPPSPLHE